MSNLDLTFRYYLVFGQREPPPSVDVSRRVSLNDQSRRFEYMLDSRRFTYTPEWAAECDAIALERCPGGISRSILGRASTPSCRAHQQRVDHAPCEKCRVDALEVEVADLRAKTLATHEMLTTLRDMREAGVIDAGASAPSSTGKRACNE